MTVLIPEPRTTARQLLTEIAAEFPAWDITALEAGGYRASRIEHERDRSWEGIQRTLFSTSLRMLQWRLERQEALRGRCPR